MTPSGPIYRHRRPSFRLYASDWVERFLFYMQLQTFRLCRKVCPLYAMMNLFDAFMNLSMLTKGCFSWCLHEPFNSVGRLPFWNFHESFNVVERLALFLLLYSHRPCRKVALLLIVVIPLTLSEDCSLRACYKPFDLVGKLLLTWLLSSTVFPFNVLEWLSIILCWLLSIAF